MKNNGTIIDKTKLKGGFSTELVDSAFFKYWTKQDEVTGYIGSPERNDFRDKAIENWLSKASKTFPHPNSVAFLLASKPSFKMMNKVSADTPPMEYVTLIKSTFSTPMKTVWEILYQTGIKALSPIKDPINDTNLAELEEGIKLFLKMKEGKPLPKVKEVRQFQFLGRYENTEPGHNKFWDHNKFWEVSATPGTSLFTSRWGKIGSYPHGFKDDYTYDEITKFVRQKEAKGYHKVS